MIISIYFEIEKQEQRKNIKKEERNGRQNKWWPMIIDFFNFLSEF